ncbi:phage baseplate assembly protein V [uncultured Aquimarina sp.]|uniref:type VI secretion system Vgr family protein n=1 Tax=uncultured Aquimarina sp. TaxID=575652 RepID=UPI002631DD2E|nr:phage baseplate assembly protein V [uncultured Aquimarina sp.]
MALQTITQIFISGVPITSYVSLKIDQEIDAHHSLALVCRTDVVEKLSEELIGDSKEYLGGTITVKISSISDFGGYKELEFKGVVTKVKATKGFQQSSGDLVTLEAKSTSILSDDGGHHASFNDMTLSEILEKTFKGYDKGKLETDFKPTLADNIHYSVQHDQSAFSFASRLAAYYNEWFYYDGQKLVFGSPSTAETELKYGVDLQKFTVELSSVPNSFDYFTNDYLTDEIHQKSSKDVSIPSDGYHGFTDKKSKELFNKQTQVYNNLYTDTSLKSRLDKQVENFTKSRAMRQVIAKGSSDNPGVNLGEIVTIKGYGSYRIIKITHTNIEGGSYTNTFEAVDANFKAYPKMDISRFPKSEIQIATVMENHDPEGLSRIKVQFPWQKPTGDITPWLRMMTPHSGGEKGFHFTPEIEEEVLVGFEGGNAEKPYVLGALYNGSKNASDWKTEKNDIKALKTRSGNQLVFDDNEGSTTITDKGTSGIKLDGNGIALINAQERNEVNVADKSTLFVMDKDGNIVFEGKTQFQIVIGDSSLILNKDGNIILKGKNILINGEESLDNRSSGSQVLLNKNAKVTGSKVDIN